jgi:hypothetical protein
VSKVWKGVVLMKKVWQYYVLVIGILLLIWKDNWLQFVDDDPTGLHFVCTALTHAVWLAIIFILIVS